MEGAGKKGRGPFFRIDPFFLQRRQVEEFRLLLADRMLEGLHEDLWAEVDVHLSGER